MALARSATGPLSPHLESFITSLIGQQYAVVCVRAKSWHAAAFDAWLAEQDIKLADVRDDHIKQFHCRSYIPRSNCRAAPRCHEVSALRQLLRYMRERGLCAPTPATVIPADELVASFEEFLLRDRGLSAGSMHYYRTHTRDFLVHRFGAGQIDLGTLCANDIIGFVLERARQTRPGAMKLVITALRAFLRYAQFRGQIEAALMDVVPAVAAWSTTPPLPRAISVEHATRAIDSCDRNTVVGLRDRAILLLLARLGLRGGEVVTLRLGDIDWDASRLRVRGKNSRECLMPMPLDVGEAIAQYLLRGRPSSDDRHLFLRTCAPVKGLLPGADGVGSIVRRALARAGVDAPHKGAHQFRHALAVSMLKGGASLPEIGEVLRHRCPISTSIYAKVDVASLRSLALPWPGGAS
jgi:site-specific recombinase XerD